MKGGAGYVEQVKAQMGKGVGMYVELFKGEGKQPYRYRLMGANGATLSVSEGYLTRWNAERAAKKAHAGVRVERDASWGT